jgi:hypothetical protein
MTHEPISGFLGAFKKLKVKREIDPEMIAEIFTAQL